MHGLYISPILVLPVFSREAIMFREGTRTKLGLWFIDGFSTSELSSIDYPLATRRLPHSHFPSLSSLKSVDRQFRTMQRSLIPGFGGSKIEKKSVGPYQHQVVVAMCLELLQLQAHPLKYPTKHFQIRGSMFPDRSILADRQILRL